MTERTHYADDATLARLMELEAELERRTCAVIVTPGGQALACSEAVKEAYDKLSGNLAEGSKYAEVLKGENTAHCEAIQQVNETLAVKDLRIIDLEERCAYNRGVADDLQKRVLELEPYAVELVAAGMDVEPLLTVRNPVDYITDGEAWNKRARFLALLKKWSHEICKPEFSAHPASGNAGVKLTPAETVRYDPAPECEGVIAARESLEPEGAQNGLTAGRDPHSPQVCKGDAEPVNEHGADYCAGYTRGRADGWEAGRLEPMKLLRALEWRGHNCYCPACDGWQPENGGSGARRHSPKCQLDALIHSRHAINSQTPKCKHGTPLTIYDACNTSADCVECASDSLSRRNEP